MNKSSRLFWFSVLLQACVVVLAIASLIDTHPCSYARGLAARSDISGGLKTTLDMFSNDCGRLPTTAEGLQGLITCPTNISQKLWKGPYLDPGIPVDPWGHEYVYHCPGVHNTKSCDLYSTGSGGISKSGGGDLDDINNWDPESPRGVDRSANDGIFVLALLLIPLACCVCSIATIFSPGGREFFARNRTAHIAWLMISLVAFIMFLSSLVPKVAG